MTLINIVVSILGVVATFAVWGSMYFLIRNDRVLSFSRKVIDLCHERNMRMIHQFAPNSLNSFELFYEKLPSYESMLYSFKPLKLESYFTEEEIKELTEKQTINQ